MQLASRDFRPCWIFTWVAVILLPNPPKIPLPRISNGKYDPINQWLVLFFPSQRIIMNLKDDFTAPSIISQPSLSGQSLSHLQPCWIHIPELLQNSKITLNWEKKPFKINTYFAIKILADFFLSFGLEE